MPDKNEFGLSGWPERERLVTRLFEQEIPAQVQQSVPGFQELSIPDGSALMPDLNPKRPASSSTWQVVDTAVKNWRVKIEEKRRRK